MIDTQKLLDIIDLEKFLDLRSKALRDMIVTQYNEEIGKLLGHSVFIQITIDERQSDKSLTSASDQKPTSAYEIQRDVSADDEVHTK